MRTMRLITSTSVIIANVAPRQARLTLFLTIACTILAAHSAHAQALYGSLTGNVIDSSDAAVAGAAIEAKEINTGVSAHAVTNNRGLYLIQNLSPGTYTVEISAATFSKAVQTGVMVTENEIQRVDVKLKAGSLNQNVEVSATTVALQTDSAAVSFLISGKDITSLPIGADRNYQSLYEIVPGFSPAIAAHSGAGNPSYSVTNNVNGASYSNNLTLIDGASDVYYALPESNVYVPPADAIGSVNIVTNSFNADQGTAGGAVINLSIKSGTNSFHGAAWEYNVASALEACPYFSPGCTGSTTKSSHNQFGVDVGGPIIKNKLFFFVDWERLDENNNAPILATVPTDALRQGDFSGTTTKIYDPTTGTTTGTTAGKGRTQFSNNMIPASELSAAALKLTSIIPEPNIPGTVSNDYSTTETANFVRDDIDAKINYNPTERSTYFAHYTFSPSNIYASQLLGPAGGAGAFSDQPGNSYGRIQLIALGVNHTFTTNLVLDGTLNYTRLNLGAKNTDIGTDYGSDVLGIPGTNGPDPLQGGFPYFSISGFSGPGNTNVSNPFTFRDNQIAVAANLHWVKGKHYVSFGGAYSDYGENHFQPGGTYGPRGGFSFTGGLTTLSGGAASNLYNGWADFLLGLPHEYGKSIEYTDPTAVREKEYALYVEDRWQAGANLTINYGVRYELYPYARSDHFGGITYNTNNNNVYVGDENGVPTNPGVNTGHGQFTPRLGVNYRIDDKTVIRAGFGIGTDPESFQSMAAQYPMTLNQTWVGTSSYTAAGTLVAGIPALSGVPNLKLGTFPLPATIAETFYAADFRRGYIESYNAAVERELPFGFDWQVDYVGNHTVRQICAVDLNADGPGQGTTGEPYNILFGHTAGLTQQTPRCPANYNALQTQLIRRMSGRSQLGIMYTYSKAMGYSRLENGAVSYQWAPVDYRNYARAAFDATNYFRTYGTYDLPFGKGQALLHHGIGAAIAGGWQLSAILGWESGTPFTVTSSATSLNSEDNTQTANQVKPHVAILGAHSPGHHYFDPNAFAPVTAVAFGTAPLFSVRGPGRFHMDANLKRTFAITHLFNLQFMAEAINLTNTPVFANPTSAVSDATFVNGEVTSYGGYDTITSATGNRSLLFGVKLSF
jgi:Carboxypeptidase regulatory-like domain/TonB dependent receptor